MPIKHIWKFRNNRRIFIEVMIFFQFFPFWAHCVKVTVFYLEKNAIFYLFSKFWFLALWGPFFGHFRVFSSLSFVNLLYVLQVTPIDLQTWFLAQRVFMTPLLRNFNDFWKFAFLPLLGALIFKKVPKSHKT